MRDDRSKERASRKRKRVFPPDKRRAGTVVFIKVTVITGLIIAAGIYIIMSIQKGKGANAAQGTSASEQPVNVLSLEAEAVRETIQDIQIDNISVGGLTREEVSDKLLSTYAWDVKLQYGDEIETLDNPLVSKVEELVDEIFAEEESSRKSGYTLDLSGVEETLKTQVEQVTAKWNRKPLNGQLSGWDKENSKWIYSEGEAGLEIDRGKAVQEIMKLVDNRTFKETIVLEGIKKAPALTAAAAKENYKVIGTFSTTATSNENRNNNIQLAMNALDGLVIFPGEEFSFNKTTGNRTIKRGYKPAGAYRNGEFVEEPGGGVCQVSSTLYNAIIFAGIKATERNPHSYEPSYVIPGEDAMVSYDGYSGPDLRFINRQDTSVAIRAVFKDRKLTISVLGMPILEEGVKVSMRSEKIKEYDAPTPKYEEDQTINPGQEREVTKGIKGTTWKTYLITTKDGKVVTEDYFHTTTYKGKAGVSKRNTSGVVIPRETAAPETEPSAALEETVPAEEPLGPASDAAKSEAIGPGME